MASPGARLFLLDSDPVLVAGDPALAEPSSVEPLDCGSVSSAGGPGEYGGPAADVYLRR